MSIQVGDLVMMVRRICDCPDCCSPLGIPFVVDGIIGSPTDLVHCSTNWSRDVGHAPVVRGFGTYNIPIAALVKIDPPSLDESTPIVEELTA